MLSESDQPGPHPEPPEDLHARVPPLTEDSGTWVRIHDVGKSVIHFGRARLWRFDAPNGEYGVLYVARAIDGAFIETFGHHTGTRLVAHIDLDAREFSEIPVAPGQALRLVDLTGPGLPRIDADGRLLTGQYTIGQRWSRALWAHPEAPDGILYRARHDPQEVCAAIFDRAEKKLGDPAGHGVLGAPQHKSVVARLLAQYGFGLLER